MNVWCSLNNICLYYVILLYCVILWNLFMILKFICWYNDCNLVYWIDYNWICVLLIKEIWIDGVEKYEVDDYI